VLTRSGSTNDPFPSESRTVASLASASRRVRNPRRTKRRPFALQIARELRDDVPCASCALSVLRFDMSEFEASARAPSVDRLVDLLSGGEESVLAHGLEIGNLVRDAAVRLVDAAAAHHQVLARSLRRARDRDECIRRVEAAAVLFNGWAFSFDARLEELERRNEVLARSASS
jgi:hypothetical protein